MLSFFKKFKKNNDCCNVKIEEVKEDKKSCCNVKIEEIVESEDSNSNKKENAGCCSTKAE